MRRVKWDGGVRIVYVKDSSSVTETSFWVAMSDRGKLKDINHNIKEL